MNGLAQCVGYRQIHLHLFQLLRSAQKNIFLSCRRIEWNAILHFHNTLAQVLSDKAQQGVHVCVLVAENWTDASPTTPQLHIRCQVRIVPNFGPKVKDEMLLITQTTEPFLLSSPLASALEKGAYYHAQSYVLVDQERIMWGTLGLDLDETQKDALWRWPSLFQSEPEGKLYYHAVAVIAQATPAVVEFCLDNWQQKGMAELKRSPGSQEPTFFTCINQLDIIHRFVLRARSSLYIETPVFVSNKSTNNGVAEAIANLVIRAVMNKRDFACLVLANANLGSAAHMLEKNRVAQVVQTAQFLQQTFQAVPLDLRDVTRHFFLGYLRKQDQGKVSDPVYINTTVIIRDGQDALLTTSALCDLDLSCRHTRFGAIISGPVVLALQKGLLARHLKPESVPETLPEVLRLCYSTPQGSRGSIKRLRQLEELQPSVLSQWSNDLGAFVLGENLYSLL